MSIFFAKVFKIFQELAKFSKCFKTFFKFIKNSFKIFQYFYKFTKFIYIVLNFKTFLMAMSHWEVKDESFHVFASCKCFMKAFRHGNNGNFMIFMEFP